MKYWISRDSIPIEKRYVWIYLSIYISKVDALLPRFTVSKGERKGLNHNDRTSHFYCIKNVTQPPLRSRGHLVSIEQNVIRRLKYSVYIYILILNWSPQTWGVRCRLDHHHHIHPPTYRITNHIDGNGNTFYHAWHFYYHIYFYWWWWWWHLHSHVWHKVLVSTLSSFQLESWSRVPNRVIDMCLFYSMSSKVSHFHGTSPLRHASGRQIDPVPNTLQGWDERW